MLVVFWAIGTVLGVEPAGQQVIPPSDACASQAYFWSGPLDLPGHNDEQSGAICPLIQHVRSSDVVLSRLVLVSTEGVTCSITFNTLHCTESVVPLQLPKILLWRARKQDDLGLDASLVPQATSTDFFCKQWGSSDSSRLF